MDHGQAATQLEHSTPFSFQNNKQRAVSTGQRRRPLRLQIEVISVVRSPDRIAPTGQALEQEWQVSQKL